MRPSPAVARCVPFGIFIGMLILGSLLSWWYGVDESNAARRWLIVARGAVVALALAWFWRWYEELRQPPRAHRPEWVLALLAGLAVFLVWIAIKEDWAVVSPGSGFDPRLPTGEMDWTLAIGRVLGFALVVPVMEELFWRSFLLRWIEKHDFLAVQPGQIGWRSFVITAVLFGLEHDRWLAGVAAGMVYNALYMRTGNLWIPIVAHAVTNGALAAWILYGQHWQYW